jgi:phosphoribosyl 1,2-cyclic phosphodiesterase
MGGHPHRRNEGDASMTVFFRSLCSSSSGNCLKLWTEETTILIDCGIKAQYRCHELLDRHVDDPGRLGAVLVTHSHGDHIGYPALRALADRGVCLRAHTQVLRQLEERLALRKLYGERNLKPFEEGMFRIGPFQIQPVPLPHSPGIPTFGFVIWHGEGRGRRKIVVGTDFHDRRAILPHLLDADFMFVEANHDLELLRLYPNPNSAYHMSNPSTAGLLYSAVSMSKKPPQAIMLGHLSEQRNEKTLARAALRDVFRRNRRDVDFALHTAPLYEPSRMVEIG